MDFNRLNSDAFKIPVVSQVMVQFVYRVNHGDAGTVFRAIRKNLRRWNSQDRVLAIVRAILFPADSVGFTPVVGNYVEDPSGRVSRITGINVDSAGLNYTIELEEI